LKLILIRHGETIGNFNRINEGHLDGELSQLGAEQVNKLALRLKDEKIDVIYCSDLGRAKQTCNAIIENHLNIPVFYVEDLREKNIGDFTGKSCDCVDWNNLPNNAETHEQFKNRIVKLFDLVYKKYKNKTVLFVAHYYINSNLLSYLLKESKVYRQDNTCVNILEIKNNKVISSLINCTKHLK